MRRGPILITLSLTILFSGLLAAGVPPRAALPMPQDRIPGAQPAGDLFATHDRCFACHVSRSTDAADEVPIGDPWSASMMANAARDPYWHGAVRAETLDHPDLRAAIEDKCSTCHMPMARLAAAAHGGAGEVFATLADAGLTPGGTASAGAPGDLTHLAMDGVSCALCHQITPERLGDVESYDGEFVVDVVTPSEQRVVYGPFDVDAGRARLMRSSSSYVPERGTHLQESDMCGSCHTLFTHYVDPAGGEGGEFAEQMPYVEWLHSDYRNSQSCQDCHMPEVEGEASVSAVLPQARSEVSRHAFRGGNRYMLSLFDRYRDELGVVASPEAITRAIDETGENLSTKASRVNLEEVSFADGILEATVAVENLAGHKLPSAYPSRRVWLHVTVRDASGRAIFESGALEPDGSIRGNDNDADATRFEPHYDVVETADEVQIYEPIIVDATGSVTTGLLWGARYIKDNRLLPRGFDIPSADAAIAVQGAALDDVDFRDGGDRVHYRIPLKASDAPLTVEVALLYQSIGYRWARNLGRHESAETSRFLDMHDETGGESAFTLARDLLDIE